MNVDLRMIFCRCRAADAGLFIRRCHCSCNASRRRRCLNLNRTCGCGVRRKTADGRDAALSSEHVVDVLSVDRGGLILL